jgi:hypothetical protein
MNLFEFCERYHISLAKARKIAKDNPAWFNATGGAFDLIRATIANGDRLTALQLIELIENPAGLLELGKYAPKAEEALAALGKPKGQVAPKLVVANVMEAAKGEPEAVLILVNWLKEILPEKPVSHAFIATRLLLGIPETLRKSEGARIPRALLNVRKHEEFKNYWHVEKGVSRNKTVYQKKGFDL